jgi:hypothetical protein
MYKINGPWDSGHQGETNPMPTPQSLEQCFTLLGCIMAVYISARLLLKGLIHAIASILFIWRDDEQIDPEIDPEP